MLALRDEGITMIVSSHILAELEDYCSEMMILAHGRVVEHRSLRVPGPGTRRLQLELAATVDDLVQRLEGLRLEGLGSLENIALNGTTVAFDFAGDAAARHALLRKLIARDIPVCGLAEQRQSLQDAYLSRLAGTERHES